MCAPIIITAQIPASDRHSAAKGNARVLLSPVRGASASGAMLTPGTMLVEDIADWEKIIDWPVLSDWDFEKKADEPWKFTALKSA